MPGWSPILERSEGGRDALDLAIPEASRWHAMAQARLRRLRLRDRRLVARRVRWMTRSRTRPAVPPTRPIPRTPARRPRHVHLHAGRSVRLRRSVDRRPRRAARADPLPRERLTPRLCGPGDEHQPVGRRVPHHPAPHVQRLRLGLSRSPSAAPLPGTPDSRRERCGWIRRGGDRRGASEGIGRRSGRVMRGELLDPATRGRAREHTFRRPRARSVRIEGMKLLCLRRAAPASGT